MKENSIWKSTLLFLFINFGALALGGFLQGEGPSSEWYQSLHKAPWTPPGWFFGFAWTTIMICFSFFMAKLTQTNRSSSMLGLFAVQFVLNVIWNPLFFHFHQMGIALVSISSLTVLVGYFLFTFKKEVGNWQWLVLPYFAWLLVATTLNIYALMYN